jgi:hypothetical protein
VGVSRQSVVNWAGSPRAAGAVALLVRGGLPARATLLDRQAVPRGWPASPPRLSQHDVVAQNCVAGLMV